MSLGVVIKGPEGIVLAADSRVTLRAINLQDSSESFLVNFDNATKLLSFSNDTHKHIASVTYGAAVIGSRTAHSFVPELENIFETEFTERQNVVKYAKRMSSFFLEQWNESKKRGEVPDVPMTFIVAGYDPGAAYGRVFLFDIPVNPDPIEQNAGENEFGLTWGGQSNIASRIIKGFDPILPDIFRNELGITDDQMQKALDIVAAHNMIAIPYGVLPLQDCVNLAELMVRTTMDMLNVTIHVRGVGGPIDIATITRKEGLRYIRRKHVSVAET